jgi:ribosomal protein S8
MQNTVQWTTYTQSINSLKKTQEYRQKIYMAFIDYRKAFDSVKHTKIIDSIEAIAIHPKYIRLIQEIDKNSNAKVKTELEGVIQNENRSQTRRPYFSYTSRAY